MTVNLPWHRAFTRIDCWKARRRKWREIRMVILQAAAAKAIRLTPAGIAAYFGFLDNDPHVMIATSSEWKLHDGAGAIVVDFKGHNFTYGPNGPTGGILTALQVNSLSREVALTLTGMTIPLATLAHDLGYGGSSPDYVAARKPPFGGQW